MADNQPLEGVIVPPWVGPPSPQNAGANPDFIAFDETWEALRAGSPIAADLWAAAARRPPDAFTFTDSTAHRKDTDT